MAYTSITAITNIIPGLPQTTSSNGYSETSLVIGTHITRSDAFINGKIFKRYAVPISPTPPLLANLSEDLTSYYAYRSFYTQDNLNQLEFYDELRATVMDTLEQIREGKLDLFDTAGSEISEKITTSGKIADSTHKDYQPFFDIDDSFNWKFDDDLKSDVDDKR